MHNFFESQWVEVFRAGEQTDSAGNVRKWTDSDLKKMVKNYNSQKDHEAPLVVGHPKDNAPAFGWVEELKTDGKSLFAKFKQIVPEFVEAVKQGLYKKRSISLYPDLMLRHIGFLGAMPPAVKGLADIKFEEEENAINIEFNELDKEYEMDELKKQIETLANQVKNFEEKVADLANENDNLKKENEEIKAEQKKENPEFSEAQKKIEALQVELNAQKKANRIAEYKEFVGGLHAEGKIVSDLQKDIIDLMEALNGVGEFNFSDKKDSALDRFKAYLEAQPAMVEFKEAAKNDKIKKNMSASEQIDEMAQAKAKESNISYTEALAQVQEENYELALKASKE
jgi:regulator of replication initiation timing